MKELSIEEKARRYDEAIERARIWKDKSGMPKDKQGILDDIFPELTESEDERIVKELLTFFRESIHGGHILTNKEYDSWIAWLEKQGQKPADKVEPKFKVGDFIVNDYCFGKVIALTDDAYLLDTEQGIPFSCEHNVHLWTIQEAKDGDVVVDKSDGTVGIFQSIGHHPDGGSCNDPSYCFLHCRYDDGYFYADFENGNTMDSDDVIPATKEQRDLLFQKMKESGYEWSDKDRKLIKIVK